MARPLRIEYPGACFHVLNRGNFRRNLFAEDRAGEVFVAVLGEAAERFAWRIHAYVVMRNHFHLALEIGEPSLGEGMKWLQGTWARRTNVFHERVGRPFQGRYQALLVEPGGALARVCAYIHLNPVRAGIVGAEAAATFPRSSLARLSDPTIRPAWLDPRGALALGPWPDEPAGWSAYAERLAFIATDRAARAELGERELTRGWCIGSADFRRHHLGPAAAARAGGVVDRRFVGLQGEALRAVRAEVWELRLQALAAAAGIDLQRLGPRKSDPDKVLLAAALKRTTSVSNAWLAQRLAMGQPASASQFARREELTEAGRARIEALVSRIET